MKKLLNYLYLLPLFFSSTLLIYFLYKSEIVFSGEMRHFYLKYYILSLLLILLTLIFILINSENRIKFILISTSIFFSLYIIEAYLEIQASNIKIEKHENKKKKIKYSKLDYDKRSKIEIYKDEKKLNDKIVLYTAPAELVSLDIKDFLPLSSISNTLTIFCNENGYYPIYKSDRYGFNNPDEEWDKNEIEYLIIGDSFAQGSCVHEKDNVAGNLRKFISEKKGVINLGHGGNGPLTEYATLREYIKSINPKKVIWMYYEANDLLNLKKELNNNVLINYLNNSQFSQNLIGRQHEVDFFLKKIFKKNLKKEENEIKTNDYSIKKTFSFLNFIKLTNTRKLTLEKYFGLPNKNFKTIMQLTKNLVEKKNGQLIFVYVPEYSRYKKNYIIQDSSNLYKKIIKIVDELNIENIDLNKDLFLHHKDPLSLFPFNGGHNNELGYSLISEIIFKKYN